MGKIMDIICRYFEHDRYSDEKQVEIEIFQLIDNLVPKKYDSAPPLNEYELGMECAYTIIKKRIAKLKED